MADSPSHALPSAPAMRGRSISISGGNQWLIGTVLVVVLLYYLIGVDEGAYSLFGSKSMFIHEFVHDARHFLGFPCH
jgi:hypothetical protein